MVLLGSREGVSSIGLTGRTIPFHNLTIDGMVEVFREAKALDEDHRRFKRVPWTPVPADSFLRAVDKSRKKGERHAPGGVVGSSPACQVCGEGMKTDYREVWFAGDHRGAYITYSLESID